MFSFVLFFVVGGGITGVDVLRFASRLLKTFNNTRFSSSMVEVSTCFKFRL